MTRLSRRDTRIPTGLPGGAYLAAHHWRRRGCGGWHGGCCRERFGVEHQDVPGIHATIGEGAWRGEEREEDLGSEWLIAGEGKDKDILARDIYARRDAHIRDEGEEGL